MTAEKAVNSMRCGSGYALRQVFGRYPQFPCRVVKNAHLSSFKSMKEPCASSGLAVRPAAIGKVVLSAISFLEGTEVNEYEISYVRLSP